MELCGKDRCFGCGACAAKCPTNCIAMELDEQGFDYPVIDQTKCVDCKSCVTVCPAINRVEQREPIKTYAAWIKDEKAHESSTSGGVSDALAQTVIAMGGVVFGAQMNPDFSVCHSCAGDRQGIQKFKQSKYVQSRTKDTYRQVKQCLAAGKKVLYTGTPCQIAGLQSYIGNHKNLYLADIICHGTPAFDGLRRHIEQIEEKCGKKANSLSFRGSAYQLKLKLKQDILYAKKSTEDLWYMGFLRGLFYKEACYTCPFADRHRAADITMGDFWGLQDAALRQQAKHGVSVMLVNTEKGMELCDKASELLQLTERDTDEAVAGNKQLRHPMPYHPNRGKFYRLLDKYGFEKAAKKSLRKERLFYKVVSLLGRG